MSKTMEDYGIIQPNWTNANVITYSWNSNYIEYHIDSVTGTVTIDFEPYQTNDEYYFQLCVKNITGNTIDLVSSNAESVINESLTNNNCLLLQISALTTTVFVGVTH